MSQVKRFVTTCDCVSEADWGDYVRHSDYAALEAECVRLREALEVIVDNSEDRSAVDYAKGALSRERAAK
jgi:hypothetical protein